MLWEKSRSVCSSELENVGITSEMLKQHTNPNSKEAGAQRQRELRETDAAHGD